MGKTQDRHSRIRRQERCRSPRGSRGRHAHYGKLFNTGDFTILERQRIDDILSEQGLASDGYVDGATGAGMGKLLGVDFLISGAITQFTTETAGGVVPLPLGSFGGVAVGTHTAYVTLDVRAINSTTGEILLAAREQGAANATVG